MKVKEKVTCSVRGDGEEGNDIVDELPANHKMCIVYLRVDCNITPLTQFHTNYHLKCNLTVNNNFTQILQLTITSLKSYS